MDENRIDRLLGDDNNTEEEAIAQLSQLARAHGAESRAADIVAEKALIGRFRFSPGLGWMEWRVTEAGGGKWDTDDIAEPRVVETVRLFIDETERDYRAEQTECESAAKMWWQTFVERLTEDERKALELAKPEDARKAILAKATEAEGIVWRKCVEDGAEAKRQADIWLNLLSAGKISAITKLCRGMEGIVTRSTDFDAHPDLINCQDGVVDLRTGEYLPADPDLLLTHMAGGFTKFGKSPLWDKALEAVPEELREWFQVRMGQSITGHTPDDDALVVCAGGGENGKSAVMSAIMRACGTYGRLISHRVLIAQPGQHPTELMDLRGLRFALLEETPEEGHLDTHQLKTTIGTPQITARRMRRDDVTFDTSHTLWVNTNFLPQVDTTDHGTWRRLKAMPWPFKFVKPGRPVVHANNERPGDLTLKPKLATDPAVPHAVLSWLIEGAVKWYKAERISAQDPPMVAEASKTWRATTDVGFLFATETLVASDKHFILATEMSAAFGDFLTEQGKRAWSAQTVNTRLPDSLEQAGILVTATPVKNAKVREGDLESRPPAPQPVDDGWKTVPAPTKPWKQWQAGQQARMWRGVRFKTEAERSAGNLTAVS